jgi:hypothetical protein
MMYEEYILEYSFCSRSCSHAHEITFLQLYGLFNIVSTLLKKRYHLWKMLGFV